VAGYAWPNRGVRPYESLWCLTQRFLWLNRPSCWNLVQTLELPATNIFVLSLICTEVGKRRFEQETLRRLLRLSDLQWSRATLDMGTVANQTCPEMRFCPECLGYAYHTALFQLLTVADCAVHGCKLIRGCPHCGKDIPATLKTCLLRAPFACPQCKKALAEAPVIIDSPRIEPHRGIATIAHWYQWVAGLPRAESRPLPSIAAKKPEMDSPVLALLEIAGRKRAPDTVKLNRQPLMEGSVLIASFGIGIGELEDDLLGDFDRERRNASFYKSYRRHLQKKIPGAQGLICAHARGLERSSELPISTASLEAKTAAFALLLFRWTMEGWDNVHAFYRRQQPALVSVHRGFEIPCEVAGLHPCWAHSFRCSGREHQWLLDHFFVEAIRCVFAEAVSRAREMVRSGAYHMESLTPSESYTRPYSLGIFDPQGRLEFWSLRLGVGKKGANMDREVSLSGADSGVRRAGIRGRLALALPVARIAAPLHPSLVAPVSSSGDGSALSLAPTSVP